jgi:putative membrane protein
MTAPDRTAPGSTAPGVTEPDYRFSLANERTFLAWVRTSLALLAGGVGVLGVANHFSSPNGRKVLGITLIVLGGLSSATAYARWRASDDAIRRGLPLPGGPVLRFFGFGLTAAALIALVLALLQAV